MTKYFKKISTQKRNFFEKMVSKSRRESIFDEVNVYVSKFERGSKPEY